MREERERHFNMVLMSVPRIIDELLNDGLMVPSTIAGLVQVAKQVADDNAHVVGDDYFEACLKDVIDGGDGLQVGKYGKNG